MGSKIDLIGMRFGRLVAVREIPARNGIRRWKCKCDCGVSIETYQNALRVGATVSCGCLKSERAASRVIDLTGKIFGRLQVIRRVPTIHGAAARWQCRCECGRQIETDGIALRRKRALSCGCGRRDAITKHGASGTTTYGSWQAMLSRCTNKNVRSWASYGGRGINVCRRWRKFENFLADMGKRPEGKTIDRINNDGDYEPGNCRWATQSEQFKNRPSRQMSDSFNVTGRSFVVTGGAGHLGRYFCAGLANARAHVLCLSSKAGEFEGLLNPGHCRIESVVCDVTDEVDFERRVQEFVGRRGGLDGLVNNAVRSPRGIDLDMPKAQFDAAMGSILTHYFTCSRIALRTMKPGGSILNVASMWGMVSPSPEIYPDDMPIAPSVAMPAAAGGILGLTRYLAVLTAKDNIRCNALVPGWFPKKRGPDRLDYMEQITSRVPMGRIGQPQELVGAAIFLLSGAASYVTGQTLVVDGGFGIR